MIKKDLEFSIRPKHRQDFVKVSVKMMLLPEEAWALQAYAKLSTVGMGEICAEAIRKILKNDKKFRGIVNKMSADEKEKLIK